MCRRIVALAVLGMVFAGCGGNDQSNSNPPEIPASPPALTATQTTDIPLARYVLTPQDAAVFQNATIVLAAQCAQRFGVTTSLRPMNRAMASDALLLTNRYGLVDESSAKRFGYNKTGEQEVLLDEQGKASAWNPTPREAEVMNGTTADGKASSLTDSAGATLHQSGCMGEANEKLQQNKNFRADLIQLVSEGLGDAMSRTTSDQRFLDAQAAWKTCMAAKGYNFATRNDAAASVAKKPVAQQVPTATADIGCAQASNYLGVQHALDVAYQQRFIDERAAQFTTSLNGVTSALQRAREIVATRG